MIMVMMSGAGGYMPGQKTVNHRSEVISRQQLTCLFKTEAHQKRCGASVFKIEL